MKNTAAIPASACAGAGRPESRLAQRFKRGPAPADQADPIRNGIEEPQAGALRLRANEFLARQHQAEIDPAKPRKQHQTADRHQLRPRQQTSQPTRGQGEVAEIMGGLCHAEEV